MTNQLTGIFVVLFILIIVGLGITHFRAINSQASLAFGAVDTGLKSLYGAT